MSPTELLLCPPPTGRGHIGFGADPVGVGVTLSCLHMCLGLTSQSTIFQSCRDGATASWVINQYFRGVKCLAQGHNTAAVGFEPPTSRSGVRHATTDKPKSVCLHVVSWTIGWNVTKFASLCKSNRINRLLDFGELDLIFKVTASWLKLPPQTGMGGVGHLFSLKILLYSLKVKTCITSKYENAHWKFKKSFFVLSCFKTWLYNVNLIASDCAVTCRMAINQFHT